MIKFNSSLPNAGSATLKRVLGRVLAPAAAILLTTLQHREATAQNATTMAQVQTVFSRRATGNAFFNRNLRAALQKRGLRFTGDKSRADAFLDTAGQSLPNGGFRGEMSFIGRGGHVLRRENVTRPPGSSAMAYRSLALRFGRASKR